MDFINNYFKEYKSSFIVNLKEVGMEGELADNFLSTTVVVVINIIKNSHLEKTIEILLSENPSNILKSANVNAMAEELGISNERISVGLDAIAPVISQVFKLKINEIVAATASLAWNTKSGVNSNVKEFY